jgi:quercetin dioxygenase-like cupin family protein
LDLAEFTQRYVVRFDALEPAKTAPPDVILERFQRERFMVLGRKSERRPEEMGCDLDTGINLAYVRCEPGKGFCAHAHSGWEIFVPMNGTWRVQIEGRDDIEIGAWDAVIVPGDLLHAATNISQERAVLLGINPGNDTASFTLSPEVAREIAEARATAEAEPTA